MCNRAFLWFNQLHSRMLERFPFWDRAALLAGLMVIGAVVDMWRHGRAATRHKEYAFIWFTGLIGCLVGGATDVITSSISEDYFITGKGLSGDNGFELRVAMFGIKQGLSAGVIAGAVCVYVSRRKSKFAPLGFGGLLRLLWMPVICAVAGSVLLPLAAGHFYPAGLDLKLEGAPLIWPFWRFRLVWWIHMGLYAGLLIGLLWLIVVVVRRRRAGPEPAART
jgi:hypothetical protein